MSQSSRSYRTFLGAEPGTDRSPEGTATAGPHGPSNSSMLDEMKRSSSVTKSKPGLIAFLRNFGWVGDAMGALQPTDGQGPESGWSAKAGVSGTSAKAQVTRVAAGGASTPWAMTGGLGAELGGVVVGGTGAWDAHGAERGIGVGGRVHKDNWLVGGNVDTVYQRDEDGGVLDRIGGGASFGPQGAAFKGNRTRDGHGRSVGMNVADGQLGLSGGATHKNGAGVTAGLGFADSAVSGSLGGSYKGKGASVSFHAVDDRAMASIDSTSGGGAGGDAARWFGETAVSYGLHDATSVGGRASATVGPATVRVGGYVADHDTARFHTTMEALLADYDPQAMKTLADQRVGTGPYGYVEPIDPTSLEAMDSDALKDLAKSHPDLFQAYVGQRFEARVSEARSFESLDLASLGAGEAMSYQTGQGSGVSGGVSAYGIGASLGMDEQSIEELAIGRDATGRIQVKVSAMDEEAMNASIGVGGGLIGIGGKNTEGRKSHVEFTVDDSPEGLKALEEFQQTGLLPGAREAVQGAAGSEALMSDWRAQMDRVGELDAQIAAQTDPIERDRLEEQRAEARSELTRASGAMNKAMLQRDDWDLSAAEVPGVDYTTHEMAQHESDKSTFSLAGWSWSWGTSFSEYIKKYEKNGATEREFGGSKSTDYWFDEDERSNVVTNPEDLAFNGYEIELGMFSEQDPSAREREVLAGLEYSGLRDGYASQWAQGDIDSSKRVQVSLVMSGAQLDHMGQAFDGGDDFWKRIGTDTAEYDWTARFPNLKGASPETREVVEDNSVARALATDRVALAIEEDRNGGFRETFFGAEWDRLVATDASFLELVQMRENMLANIAAVETSDDFAALSENEQGLAIGSFVMQSVEADENPWDAAHMVLAIEDPEIRAKHFRTLFMTYEHATEGSNATIDFIEWVQDEGASNGLEQGTIDDLLSGARVEIEDGRVDDRAEELAGALSDPELLDKAGQWLAESADDIDVTDGERMAADMGWRKSMATEADEAGDWVQAADKAGGTELVEEMVRKAAGNDPWFAGRYLRNIAKVDASRARVVAEILAETEGFGEVAQHHLDLADGVLPWWAHALPGPAALPTP